MTQPVTVAPGHNPIEFHPGQPSPMGATPDAEGTNFVVYSASASEGGVSLCLFADDGSETRLPMTARSGDVWHAYVPGIRAGQRYGYRVSGPWNPGAGLWANEAKPLLDPWSKAIDGGYDGDSSACAHLPGDRTNPDPRDSAPHTPRSVVVDPSFDWGDDTPPGIALAYSIIYETHVRGLTKEHPQVPDPLKGTYAGLVSDPIIRHLTSLGITAVELMPVHQFLPAARPVPAGLTDYWGYMTVGFFAPHGAYSSVGTRGQQVTEFKSMVKALQRVNIEVILDVVYNHSAEGNPDGPSVAFRGLDNPAYYWLDPTDPSNYYDYSGTGNTLDVGEPEVLLLILSSLRYWVSEMHVDGFRFDLAAVLARQEGNLEKFAAFLDLIYQDPVISQVKLIAEPWDADGGYVLGQFPPPWAQWNDHYRANVRDFWRAQAGIGDLATRLAGSADVFARADQSSESSINVVTCHDGFTLADLVSYNGKHNQANGENNRDGSDDNRSWNCGAEGRPTDPAIVALRAQQRRNFLATMLISLGVPMILSGDEIGSTQQGNNNAYCQDNAINWYDWDLDQERRDLLAFTARAIGLRREHPVFRRGSFLTGQQPRPSSSVDVAWLWTDGTPMTLDRWNSGSLAFAVWLNGAALTDTDTDGKVITDDTFMILFNASWNPQVFTLPSSSLGATWMPVLDTTQATGSPAPSSTAVPADSGYTLSSCSLLVLRRTE
ncbi:MAG: glycogen debranching protein GlgX [Mycobacterium sp.]|uniref:glycogen debranching protein GlgX n=1 Tax=Mycobacterium sp. TaxID=1785 RepID=UPI0026146155|nr:glycogen debranching protein GlgX [Mycobacterium sp.]MDI3313449.1 glycogen debranching protein GlgX [Mycobacterium sp.]